MRDLLQSMAYALLQSAAVNADNRIVQFSAILLELGGALLVALLFAIIRRSALHRGYFATWTTAWYAMVVAIAAVGARYILFWDVNGPAPDESAAAQAYYFVYQAGKVTYWLLLLRGALEFVRPARAPLAWWVGAAVAFTLVSWSLSTDLNYLLMWQAPVAVITCAWGATALLGLPPGRRTFGSTATGAVLGLTAPLWLLYFFVFGSASHTFELVPERLNATVTQFNSYADMLMLVMLGYAMLVLFMEDARHRISESEERLAALVSSSADAIVTTDAGFLLLDANAAADQLFGLAVQGTRGKHLEDIALPADRERLRQAIESFVQSDSDATILGEEDGIHGARADGSAFTAEFAVTKLRSGDSSSLAVVVRDVTQRRMNEERRLLLRKMEAVRQLAGGLAHDFNNLLTAIIGRSQMIARTLPPDSAERDGVGEIERAAGAAARLSRGLLSLSRREPLAAERIPLNAAVRRVEAKIRTVAGPLVQCEFRYHEDAGVVLVDAMRFEEVLLALAQNAREAMAGVGGKLEVETARVDRPRVVADHVEASCLFFRDTGPGLAPDARAHLFEPFFSTKGDGRGLGLATAWAFVHQSGGTVDVESSARGTVVRLLFPVASAEAIPARAVHERAPVPAGRAPRTVLVAEDEAAVRRFVRIVLEKEGFRVLEAANGVEAIDVFASAEGGIDLLLTDVVMPQMGGRELAGRLVREREDLRVVFMSGFVNDPEMLNVVNERRVPFLQKPFDIEALAKTVRDELADVGARAT